MLIDSAHNFDGVYDRRQRIAQFMSQHRKEFIFTAIGLLQSRLNFLLAADIDAASVPAHDLTGVVADINDTGFKPAVSAIAAAQPILNFKRLAGFTSRVPERANASPVFRFYCL